MMIALVTRFLRSCEFVTLDCTYNLPLVWRKNKCDNAYFFLCDWKFVPGYIHMQIFFSSRKFTILSVSFIFFMPQMREFAFYFQLAKKIACISSSPTLSL